MRKYILIILSFWSILGFGKSPVNNYYFVEVKSHKETSHLPPKLEATFEIFCNETFVKVIRNDFLDPITKETNITIGILVKENLLSSCAGSSKEMTVSAGFTFSGRPYSVSTVKGKRP